MLVINIAPISILGFDPTIPSCLCWMAGFQRSACSWDETPVMLPAAKGPGALHQIIFVENLTTFETLCRNRVRYPACR
jgi:hypothetical protein